MLNGGTLSITLSCSQCKSNPKTDRSARAPVPERTLPVKIITMKKVLIIGASGSLAPCVIDAVSTLPDVELTLFVRSKRNLQRGLESKYPVIEGDALQYASVKNAISGQDIVYVNLAGDLETMAANIVKAMQETGGKRIIAISSIGIYDTPLKAMLKPYRALADIITASGLEYTILRPDWFTNADESDYALTRKGQPETGTAISRKSIAAFVASVIKDPSQYQNADLGISKPA